jgi:hypothetical protein
MPTTRNAARLPRETGEEGRGQGVGQQGDVGDASATAGGVHNPAPTIVLPSMKRGPARATLIVPLVMVTLVAMVYGLERVTIAAGGDSCRAHGLVQPA